MEGNERGRFLLDSPLGQDYFKSMDKELRIPAEIWQHPDGLGSRTKWVLSKMYHMTREDGLCASCLKPSVKSQCDACFEKIFERPRKVVGRPPKQGPKKPVKHRRPPGEMNINPDFIKISRERRAAGFCPHCGTRRPIKGFYCEPCYAYFRGGPKPE